MNKTELQAFEYAVDVFNEMAKRKKENFKEFKILWSTTFGPAFGNNIIYSSPNFPIIDEYFQDGEYHQTNSRAGTNDLYSVVRHKVYRYFDQVFIDNLKLEEYPHILMNELINLSRIENPNEVQKPTYSSVWNFKTLDGSIDLPFINDDSLIQYPISLLRK
ncbi:hypothetical protein GUI51_09470 [Enterococcus mundtii]|uniref:Uncharacterized protein n=1 Tax=Enterococcus mundtii TaxID=53346 RepID=A0ABQ0VGJ7_ENTMU|nr:hypothetical protein [Enterococcus mundtii]GEN20746.1 hypothetical protein LAC02_40270 [Ligilactobacillus acidipiscis]AUB52998.1 hypothetical protein EM4838_08315 [Enterococcus mundtii]MZZ58361.1 hypothetical protein [Enterococcus mundtii]MZZ61337.1 hypothetical protein [Enterococcus mundtii]MZZ68321.1 hypothetical protein [Enterococcus mundtii]